MTKDNYSYIIAAMILTLFLPLSLKGETKSAAKVPHALRVSDSEFLEKTEVFYQDKKPWVPEAPVEKGENGDLTIHLGVGEPVALRFVLHPKPGVSATFRMEQQYETSLSLMKDGPHLDLIHWKHHVSPWETLKEAETNTFVSKEVSGSEFPEVTNAEIVAAVKAQLSGQGYSLGGDWADLAKKCESPNDDPCGVSISQVRLRISVKEGENWKAIQIIRLIVPMGC